MSIKKLRAGRIAGGIATTWVGEKGTIFWDEVNGELRLSDGHTPGGKVLNPAVAASSTTPPPTPYEGELWYNPSSKELWAYYNGAFRGTINPATPTELGGIKAGPGVVVASDGTLTLDSTGIPFNFGDFYAFTNPGTHDGACLSSINANQDVNIVSNGTGSVNIVGVLNIHPTDDTVENALSMPPVFAVNADGITAIHAPSLPIGNSVVTVSANASNTVIPLAPGAVGAVLQLVGADDNSTTVALDNFSNVATSSSNFTFRRYRGTIATPLAVQSGDLMAAMGSTAFDGTGTATLPAQVTSIRFTATENQTLTNKGSRIDMYAIPTGTASRTLNLSLLGTQVSVPLTTESTSTTSGALVTAGGLGVVKNAYIGGALHASTLAGKLIRGVRNAGTIAANGTVTVDFSTDDIVYCTWSTGLTIGYQNYIAGSVVRVIATKATGSGTGPISLGGVTPANVSNGSTSSSNIASDSTAFIELTCTNTTIGSVYVKL